MTTPLDDVNAAMTALEKGEVLRSVLVMQDDSLLVFTVTDCDDSRACQGPENKVVRLSQYHGVTTWVARSGIFRTIELVLLWAIYDYSTNIHDLHEATLCHLTRTTIEIFQSHPATACSLKEKAVGMPLPQKIDRRP